MATLIIFKRRSQSKFKTTCFIQDQLKTKWSIHWGWVLFFSAGAQFTAAHLSISQCCEIFPVQSSFFSSIQCSFLYFWESPVYARRRGCVCLYVYFFYVCICVHTWAWSGVTHHELPSVFYILIVMYSVDKFSINMSLPSP